MITHRPNYHTTHMLASVRKKKYAQSERARLALNVFEQSVKFVCPVNGVFFEDTNLYHYLEGVRIPYKSIVLEYDGELDKYGHGGQTVGVCVLAMQNDRAGREGVEMFVAIGSNVVGWGLLDASLFIPSDINADDLAKDTLVGALICPFDDKVWLAYSEAERSKVTNAMVNESLGLLQFCAAMNCSNVETETIRAPKMINARRALKKELPLFEYHVLTVDVRHRNEHGEAKGGTHASPRQHLRRGHIRRYKSGLTIWIQPMTVGSAARGKISKDYRVKASEPPTANASHDSGAQTPPTAETR